MYSFDLNDFILNMQKTNHKEGKVGKDGGISRAAACGKTKSVNKSLNQIIWALKQENVFAERTSGKWWQRKKKKNTFSFAVNHAPTSKDRLLFFFSFSWLFLAEAGIRLNDSGNFSRCTVEQRWSSNYAAQMH